MASPAVVASRRLTAIRTLAEEAKRLADHLGIAPPEKPAKTMDQQNGYVKQLESTVDFIQRVNHALKIGDVTTSTVDSESPPADEPPPEPGIELDDGEEPSFRGKPLSFYDGKNRDELIAIKGIAEKTADEILAARAKRDAAR
jgi:hypothetical protein